MRSLSRWMPLCILCSSCLAVSYNLVGTEFNQSSFTLQPYVANGYIGQRLPVEGHGYSEITPVGPGNGTNGWPLFDTRFTAAIVSGFYDVQDSTIGTNYPQNGGEQVISTLPTWSSLYVTVNGQSYGPGVDPVQVSNYSQSMSIQNGIVSTALTWTPPGGHPVQLNYTVFAHRNRPTLAVVHLDVSGLQRSDSLTVTDVLDGAGAWRTTPKGTGFYPNTTNVVWSAVSPLGVDNVTAYEVSVFDALMGEYFYLPPGNASCYSGLSANASTASRCYSLSPSSGRATVVKYVGIASSDAYPDVLPAAIAAATTAFADGYNSILHEQIVSWQELFERGDIVIPGETKELQELQLVTRASLFHLLTNIRSADPPYGPAVNSIAPAGLTSDSYAGSIFWDADIWMFPPLLILFPRHAQTIVNFRYIQLEQARINARNNGYAGAQYPWIAARYGNCTGIGPCQDYELHLMNDIALAQYQYYASVNNHTWLETSGWPVVSNVSAFWASQVSSNASTGALSILNVTDPDEYANHQNNGAFTNAGVKVVMRYAAQLAGVLGISIPSNWTSIGESIAPTIDPTSGITLEYDAFNGTTEVKQADVVLLPYPLEYPQSAASALQDLDYYALRTSPNGPGMTYSIFSIDANALSNGTGCASWTYFLAASQPYSRAPFYQFSEQTNDVFNENGGTNPAFTFLTGHGGFLQALTHGFTGYRTRLGRLYFDPILTPQFTNYTIKGFSYHNCRFDVTLTTESMYIQYASGQEDIPVEIGAQNPKAGNYTLKVGGSLSIPVRKSNNKLVAGNLAQCQPLMNNTDTSFTQPSNIVPGQFSIAAIDGSNSTVWQPASEAATSIIVDLGSPKSFNKLHFNWGENPATRFEVSAGSSTASFNSISAGSPNITVPFDAATAAQVRPIIGNTTDVTLNQTVSARYVRVSISGSARGDGQGATLAEFAVIAA